MTTDVRSSDSWAVLVADGDEFLLTGTDNAGVRLATGASTPTVRGHVLQLGAGAGITRQLIGPGIVWWRSLQPGRPADAALTVWTP